MTEFFIARHGESIWHAENRYAGSSDIAITDLGRQQAADLGAWASTAHLDAIWSSDLSRCRETAAPSAASTGLEIRIDKRIRELDFGAGEGLTHAEMADAFPDAFHAFEEDPVTNHLPDGEPPARALERCDAALSDMAQAFPDGRVLVVAHGTLLRLMLCHILESPLGNYRRLFPGIRNCALTHLRFRNGKFAMISFNNPPTAEAAR